MAGSTAGWWPSDRDRFPPRFLLPPSLQTHNCIISTHLLCPSPPHRPAPLLANPPSAAFLRSLFLCMLLRARSTTVESCLYHRDPPRFLVSTFLLVSFSSTRPPPSFSSPILFLFFFFLFFLLFVLRLLIDGRRYRSLLLTSTFFFFFSFFSASFPRYSFATLCLFIYLQFIYR